MVGARPSFDGAAELQPLALGGGRGAAPFGRRVPPGACRLAGLAREPLPTEDAHALVESVYEHGLLVIPSQGGISPEDEVALAHLFPHDPAEDHVVGSYTGGASKQHKLPGSPEVALVGSFRLHKYHGFTGESPGVYSGWAHGDHAWHNDGFADTMPPPDITIMRCVLTPRQGGETLFASSVEAAAAMPVSVHGIDPERVRLRYRLFKNSKRKSNGLRLEQAEGKRDNDVNMAAAAADVCHPLVVREPRTCKRTLVGTYHVASGYVVKADGSGSVERELGFEEASSLSEACWAPGVAPDKVYAHLWSPGELVVWSNRLIIHTATPTSRYEPGAQRLMHRVRLRAPLAEAPRAWRE